MCLPWKNDYSNPLHIFKLGYLSFYISCKNSLYILDSSPLLYIVFANIFSHSVCCPFSFLMVSSKAREL